MKFQKTVFFTLMTLSLILGFQNAGRLDVFNRALESNSVLKQITELANQTTETKSKYKCWTAVHQKYLRPLGLIDKRNNPTKFYAEFAKDVPRELEGQNYINLMSKGQIYEGIKDICSLPPGVILIYDSSVPDSPYGDKGHVEVKTGAIGNGSVASDYRSPRPVTGSCSSKSLNFKLKAIMIPRSVYDSVTQEKLASEQSAPAAFE